MALSLILVSVMVGTKVFGSMTPAEVETNISANWKSVNDLMARRANIKTKIVESNARTEVIIGTESMTVAEAIERKNSIEYQKELLEQMRRNYAQSLAAVTQGNEKARDKAQQALDLVLGKDGTKTPAKDDMAAIYDPVFARYEWKLCNPISIEKKIEDLEDQIEGFLSNVDFVLSTSNALTLIEIED